MEGIVDLLDLYCYSSISIQRSHPLSLLDSSIPSAILLLPNHRYPDQSTNARDRQLTILQSRLINRPMHNPLIVLTLIPSPNIVNGSSNKFWDLVMHERDDALIGLVVEAGVDEGGLEPLVLRELEEVVSIHGCL